MIKYGKINLPPSQMEIEFLGVAKGEASCYLIFQAFNGQKFLEKQSRKIDKECLKDGWELCAEHRSLRVYRKFKKKGVKDGED